MTKQGISASASPSLALLARTFELDVELTLEPPTPAVVETDGNPACHVILRGSNSGPNFSAEHVQKAAEGLRKAGVSDKVMIDWCDPLSPLLSLLAQGGRADDAPPRPAARTATAASSTSARSSSPRTLRGSSARPRRARTSWALWCVVLLPLIPPLVSVPDPLPRRARPQIESHLVEGKQSIPATGPANLTYGQSVTDACIDWKTTVSTLDTLRQGVQQRRKLAGEQSTRKGIENRALPTASERAASADRGDFNSVETFARA